MAIKTIKLPTFTYKGVKYKFKEPLKVRVEKYLLEDGKTFGWEMYFSDVPDGFVRYEEIVDIEKEAKKFLKNVFEKCLMVDEKELSEDDKNYKEQWVKMFLKNK